MSDVRDQVAKLVELARKTLHETERLRRDVAILHGRIVPFKDEVPLPEPYYREPPRRSWPIPDALNVFEEARASIVACERELSAIRARMDSIEKDAHSREDMKPWLREK
jgi:hypothetical protein